MGLDETDQKILAILAQDARLPVKTIAGRVGLSRSSARDRIQRLEQRGVIQGYRAQLATGPEIGAFLSVQLAETPHRPTVAAIVSIPEVARCWSVSGDIDLFVELRAGDAEALNNARDRIATLPHVARVMTAMILKREKDS